MGGTIELGTAAGSAPATLLDLAGRPLTTDASKGSAFVTLVGNDGNPVDATHPISTVAGAGTPGTANTANYGPDNADAEAVTTTNLDLLSKIRNYLFNGTTYDRWRSLGPTNDGVGVGLTMQPSSVPAGVTSGANAAGVYTNTGAAGKQVRLTFLTLSQTGAAVIQATISDGTTTLTVPVPATNVPVQLPLPPGGLKFAAGATLTITVPAAGVGATSQINAGTLLA